MRLKPNKSTMTLLAAAFGLVVLIFGGILWLQQSALAEASETRQARETELEDGKRLAGRAVQARELLERDRAQIVFLEEGVSDAAYVPTLLKQVEDLAVGTNNRVLGVRPQAQTQGATRLEQRRDPDAKEGEAGGDDKPVEKPEPYTRLNIQVNMVGTYQSSQMFIQRLTRFPKIVSVDQIQLRPHRAATGPGGEVGEQGQLDIELKVTAFVMKEARPAPAAGTTNLAAAGGTQ